MHVFGYLHFVFISLVFKPDMFIDQQHFNARARTLTFYRGLDALGYRHSKHETDTTTSSYFPDIFAQ